MSKSGNKINYNLRTAKSVERKMVLAILKQLYKDVPQEAIRYIGMGSNYFADFKLFHRELNISNMINFEIEEDLQERIDFNKPFKCITNIIGKSTDLLPFLEWFEDTRNIIWMDYDSYLEYEIFTDIEIIFSKIEYGSFYLMSCNKQLKDFSIESFKEKFGELAPISVSDKDFNGENDFSLISKMIFNKISESIIARNYALDQDKKIEFHQLFLFTYQDGAPMVSFGGYIDLVRNRFTLESYNINKYNFISTNIGKRYVIDPPNLTYKEVLFLNSFLPSTPEELELLELVRFIPQTDKNKYEKLYKFLPNYMDVLP